MKSRIHPWVLGLALVTLGLSTGCGDDSTGTNGGSGGGQTDAQKLDGAMTGLTNFGQDALALDETSVLFNGGIVEILGELFPAGTGGLVKTVMTKNADRPRVLLQEARDLVKNPRRISKRGLEDLAGVYDRDVSSSADPFPGWVLSSDDPPTSDSIIFRFDGDDDFTVNEGEELVPAAGELRLLGIASDDRGTSDPLDDLLTDVVFEIHVGPADGTPETVLRIAFSAAYDAAGELTFFALGDENANSVTDSGASFLGPLLFFIGLDVVADGESTDVDLTFQLFDSIDDYALRLTLGADALTSTELEQVDFSFGFGQTMNPADPPFVFNVSANNFRPDPLDAESVIADITGSIVLNGDTVATMVGDSTDVPFDTDGDGTIDPDETCPNVNITFSDSPEATVNICEAIGDILGLADGVIGPAAILGAIR